MGRRFLTVPRGGADPFLPYPEEGPTLSYRTLERGRPFLAVPWGGADPFLPATPCMSKDHMKLDDYSIKNQYKNSRATAKISISF